MNFTDRFVNIPIKVYNKEAVGEMVREMYKSNPDESKLDDDPGWVKGWMRLPFDEIKGWHDDTDWDRPLKEIADRGHDQTFILCYTINPLECLWKKTKFEEELNKAYDTVLNNELEKEKQKKNLEMSK